MQYFIPKKLTKFIYLLIFSSCSIASYAQEINVITTKKSYKGNAYIFWGWNRGYYTKSDIRFVGNDYDFILTDVIAKDRQTPFGVDAYLNPLKMSIPQTNLKIGYFIKDHYDIALCVDHMKYVMQPGQTVKINGSITNSGTEYDGVYENEDIVLAEDFLSFEHTNGLNYINVECSRFDNIFNLKKLTHLNIDINLTEGIGAGVLVPRTNTKLLKYNRYDEFHLAGFGANAKVGLNITFFNYLFIQGEIKAGYINMPDIKTTEFTTDKAQQQFGFIAPEVVFGMMLPFYRLKKI